MRLLYLWSFYILSCFLALYGQDSVAIITVPKAGTHLIRKFMHLLLEDDTSYCVYHTDEFFFSKNLQANHSKRILLIRDPRDVCVSWMHYLKTQMAEKIDAHIKTLPIEDRNIWHQLSMKQQLSLIIRGKSKQSKAANIHPSLIYYPLGAYEVAPKLAVLPETLVCRFEHLVGEKGGGKKDLQRKEIDKILQFLNVKIAEEKIINIQNCLFGNSKTFYRGKIGSWREVFTRKHKKLFKKRKNHLLTFFGYESDDQW